jgi:hypothetical protein
VWESTRADSDHKAGLKDSDAHQPFCFTVNVRPAIVIVPERARVVLATE